MHGFDDLAPLLVIENRDSHRYSLSRSLRRLGYQTLEAHNYRMALQSQKSTPADLIFIDLDIRPTDGIRLLDKLRQQNPEIIVVLLKSSVDLETALVGLRAGAFDCLSKPVQNDALKQTVERGLTQARNAKQRRFLFKRIREDLDTLEQDSYLFCAEDPRSPDEIGPLLPFNLENATSNSIQIGKLLLHPGRYQVQSDFGEVSLTPTEFDLFLYLASNQERIVTCGELVRVLRGYNSEEQEARSLIRPHISNLRSKLRSIRCDDEGIVNVRGIGYRYSTEYAS